MDLPNGAALQSSSWHVSHSLNRGGAHTSSTAKGQQGFNMKVSAKLTNADVRFLAGRINRDRSHPRDPVLNLVGNVRYHLDRPAKVITLALFALKTPSEPPRPTA